MNSTITSTNTNDIDDDEFLSNTSQEEDTQLANAIINLLKRKAISSKSQFNQILMKQGFPYEYRLDLENNRIYPEIPNLSKVLKKLRFERKIKFQIKDGKHYFFIKNLKTNKIKLQDIDFSWQKYTVQAGEIEILSIFRIPSKEFNPQHFLASCLPRAEFSGFQIAINNKEMKNFEFSINSGKIHGQFQKNNLILTSHISTNDIIKFLYYIVQIGRKIIEESFKLINQTSHILKINNKIDFIPVYFAFKTNELKSLYSSKYNNIMKFYYDFPSEFLGKYTLGTQSLIWNERDESMPFEITKILDFAETSFELQCKNLLTHAIDQEKIIVPQKLNHYIENNTSIDQLIKIYIQNIDVGRLIDEKIEDSLESSSNVKDFVSNLLITMLGLSFIVDNKIVNYVILGGFILLNLWYYRFQMLRKKKLYK